MTGIIAGGAAGAAVAQAGALTGANGERIALQEVQLDATLRDLLCEVRAVQVYRNDEQRNIEAVYTFPLPLDAVLLDVTVTLGERVLAGTVVGKQAAEARYEAAVAEGDGAVMLELAEPGLYTMNVGNLLPGEVARIAIRYALLHRWSGDRLRLHFPTTIAPRYGAMPLQPHQQPEQSLMVENHFAFSLTVHGALREAQFSCPSHALAQGETDDALVLSLRSDKAVMDRDVVLDIKATRAARSTLLMGHDGDGTAALASFQPFFGGLRQEQALSLAIVVDCSGSMAGTSMELARRALGDILAQLQPGDRIALVAFGSATQVMSDKLLPCSGATLERARAFCDALDANMGGTEMGRALDHAHRLLKGANAGNVFLITDGQVGEWEGVVARSQATGHRHFTVGVGHAVTEPFIRTLAERTKGAAELVSPQEGMSERIVRHFERLRAARAKAVRVQWPQGAMDVAPTSFGAVFDGDTLVASACFTQPAPAGEVVLEVETEDGRTTRQALQLSDAVRDQAGAGARSTVARIAASIRLATLDEGAARELAVRYQLASPWTNWLVIAERAEGEKAQDIPALRKVPHTLAAGWGATGGGGAMPYVAHALFTPMMSPPPRFDAPPAAASDQSIVERMAVPGVHRRRMDTPMTPDLDVPDDSAPEHRAPAADSLANELVRLINLDPSRLEPGRVLDFVRSLGVDSSLDERWGSSSMRGVSSEMLATLLVAEMLEQLDPHGFSDAAREAVSDLCARAEEVREILEQTLEMAHVAMRRWTALGGHPDAFTLAASELRERAEELRRACERARELAADLVHRWGEVRER